VVVYPCPLEQPKVYDKNEARNYLEVNYDQTVLLSVGRLVRRKGFDTVIKAIPSVVKECHDVKYYILGDGPEKKRLQELIDRMELSNIVEIRSGVSDHVLSKYYSAADMFVMPNRQIGPDVEGFGLVFLEASLYKLPSIAGNSGGAPEAVKDGTTGIVVDPNSQEELVKSLVKLSCDRELRIEMGTMGKMRTEEHFKWRHEVNKLVFAYNNV